MKRTLLVAILAAGLWAAQAPAPVKVEGGLVQGTLERQKVILPWDLNAEASDDCAGSQGRPESGTFSARYRIQCSNGLR